MKYVSLLLIALAALGFWLFSDGTDPRAPRAPAASTDRQGATPAAAEKNEKSSTSQDAQSTSAEPKHVETARWRITYLGPGGVPLADLPVEPINASGGGRTDESGVITFDVPVTIDELRVFDPYTWLGRRFRERDATVRLDALLPLEVEFRAVDSGERLTVSGARLVSRTSDLALTDNRLDYSPLKLGGSDRARIRFDLPSGYTSLSGAMVNVWGGTPRTTRRVEATIALWPELELTVIARDGDEKPIAGATIKQAFLCGQFEESMSNEVHVVAAPTDEQGRTRVRGVPYLPGHPLTVLVDGGEEGSQGFDEITITKRKASMTVDCFVDSAGMPRGNSAIGIGGGATPKLAESGTAVIEVRYRDGTPAGGARYRIGEERGSKLDELGRATVDQLKPGSHTLWLCESGRVPTRAVFEIRDGESTRITLREDEGWALRVRTVDSSGKALPYRPLRITCESSNTYYALVVGGVQSVPIRTGADGSVVLPGLGREPLTVGVRIAGRTLAEAKLPYDPSRREVVLTLP